MKDFLKLRLKSGFLLLCTAFFTQTLFGNPAFDPGDIYCKLIPGDGLGRQAAIEFADVNDDFYHFRMCVFSDGSMIGINELRFGVAQAKSEFDYSTMALLYLSKRVGAPARATYSIEGGIKFCKDSGLKIHQVKPASPQDEEKLKATLQNGAQFDDLICLEGGAGYLTSLAGAVGQRTFYLGAEADLEVNKAFFSVAKQSTAMNSAYDSIRDLVGHDGDYSEDVIVTCDQASKGSIETSAVNLTISGHPRKADLTVGRTPADGGLEGELLTSTRIFLPFRMNNDKEKSSSRLIWKPGASFMSGTGGLAVGNSGKRFETSILMFDGGGDPAKRLEYVLSFDVPEDAEDLYNLIPGVLLTKKSFNPQYPTKVAMNCKIHEKGWTTYFK